MKDIFSAGCSSFSWSTEDGLHLWGRNLDFSEVPAGTAIKYIPRGSIYRRAPSAPHVRSEYAVLGTGTSLGEYSALYEGVNEAGLMGGQQYYRGFADYSATAEGEMPQLAPPMVVLHILSSCKSVAEAAKKFTDELRIVGEPLMGSVPPLHWAFSDRSGETIIIEPDKGGLSIHRNTGGVMTNSPPLEWHRQNMLCYPSLSNTDYGDLEINGDSITQCYSGTGASALPGGWSSPARFIRLSYLKKYCLKGRDERQGIIRMFRIFEDVSFPLGAVRLYENAGAELGGGRYDYTAYTSAICSESLSFYWKTYENEQIRRVCMSDLGGEARDFPLESKAEFIEL